jgi:hypothetical protein
VIATFPGLARFQVWRFGSASKKIPTSPEKTYEDKDLSSWGDWLGTCRIASLHMIYGPFEEALALVHSLGSKNKDDWTTWARSGARPNDKML